MHRRHASPAPMATATTTIPLCLPSSSRRTRTRTRTARSGLVPVRAAIVEVSRPIPAVPVGQNYSTKPPQQSRPSTSAPVLLSLPSRLTEDIQAEARALTRAVNATVYTPEFLSARYGSQPFKVLFYIMIVLSIWSIYSLIEELWESLQLLS